MADEKVGTEVSKIEIIEGGDTRRIGSVRGACTSDLPT